jgi:anti-sigma factor RsiW
MECRKWEEAGLLYAAGELTAQETAGFESHLVACGECRNELRRCRMEHERLFTAEVLGEVPSAEVDAEILRVCSNPKPNVRITAPALFAAFFRRQVFVPAMLFIVGFISVGYIMMNMENARHMTTAAVRPAATIAAPQMAQTVTDSLKDSLNGDSKANYASTRGDLNDKGVITVDLKK